MNDFPDRPPEKRVGLRAVAAAAAVSLMTASLALRNSPRLSAGTRKRVREIAEQLGYRPDPEISRLMGRLRPSRKLPGSVVIGLIDLHPRRPAQVHPYEAGVRQGVLARADALGFGISVFSLFEYGGGVKQMLRVIRHRGITGVVLLPSNEPIAFDPSVNWDGISVVSATSTVTSPQFHQAIPNHFFNIMSLIDTLHGRGLRRIAAIFSASLDRRTHQVYSIALTWHGHAERILVLPDQLADPEAAERVAAWVQHHEPDAIIGGDAMTRAFQSPKLKRLRNSLHVVSLTSEAGATTPFLDQRPDVIGECAASLLTGMMHNNETGIPTYPQVTTVRGVLREPDRSAKSTAASASRPRLRAG